MPRRTVLKPAPKPKTQPGRKRKTLKPDQEEGEDAGPQSAQKKKTAPGTKKGPKSRKGKK